MNPTSHPPVHFVIAAPRSGTTWLNRALNEHPQIHATESRLFGMFCELWQNRNGVEAPRITADKYFSGMARHASWKEAGFASHQAFFEAFFSDWMHWQFSWLARQSGKQILVDKITPYLGTSDQVVASIRKYFPHSHILYLVRDGRDVATSGVYDWIGREAVDEQEDPIVAARREAFFGPNAGASNEDSKLTQFFDEGSLRAWSRYWTEPHVALQSEDLPEECVTTIRFEEMVADQGQVLQRIGEVLAVPFSDEDVSRCVSHASFERTTGRPAGSARPLEKQRSGTVGDWRRHFTRGDGELYDALAGTQLRALGYESTDRWWQDLPDKLGSSPGSG